MSSPQQPQAAPQPSPKRKRTSAERQRKDAHSRPCRWAGVTVRSPEGKLIRDVRAELTAHVGQPSATQRVLVERAVMLTVHLARMDAKALQGGAMSQHASREYLAWSNTLTRTMRQLGLKGAAERQRTINEIMATPYAADDTHG